jgi:hypothetical protein
MLVLAAAIVANVPASSRTAPTTVAEATAIVHIVSGVRLKLDKALNVNAPPAHDSKVTAQGKLQPARLIEFE